jgi:hypothetical protein
VHLIRKGDDICRMMEIAQKDNESSFYVEMLSITEGMTQKFKDIKFIAQEHT